MKRTCISCGEPARCLVLIDHAPQFLACENKCYLNTLEKDIKRLLDLHDLYSYYSNVISWEDFLKDKKFQFSFPRTSQQMWYN